jgi:HEPN domain-containing protein
VWLAEAGIAFPKIHDLTVLSDRVLPVDPLLESSRRELAFLTDFSVRFRYPGETADKLTAAAARKMCRNFRKAVRSAMSL